LQCKTRKIVNGNYANQNSSKNEDEDGERKSWNDVPKAVYLTLPRDKLKEAPAFLPKLLHMKVTRHITES